MTLTAEEERAQRAEWFIAWMRRHGWDVKRLAARSGITRSSIYRYRSGEELPLSMKHAMYWATDHTPRPARKGPVTRNPKKPAPPLPDDEDD